MLRTPPSGSRVRHAATAGGDERIHALVVALRDSDEALLDHGIRVAGIARRLGAHLHLPADRLARLGRAALLHDVGKRSLSRTLLEKTGTLNGADWHALEAHSTFGERMLLEAGLLAEAVIVRHHHERWDGAGYPDRLAGEVIPLESRIVLVADAYDAITSDRPYRETRGPHEALAEVEAGAGTQFDPFLARELRRVLNAGSAAEASRAAGPTVRDLRVVGRA